MISVVIATDESERPLMHTLAALVPGALAGVVREVIVADAGSTDATDTVADAAGCNFMTLKAPLGARLASAAATARADWLWFLQPGCIPEPGWIEDLERFVQDNGSTMTAQPKAAVLRRHAGGSGLRAALTLAVAGLARPKPQQGLLIARASYVQLGGHDAASADPEADLLRKLGRRRIAVLGAAMGWRSH